MRKIFILLVVLLISINSCKSRHDEILRKEATLRANLVHLRESLDRYQSDKGEYPPTLNALVSSGYIRELPVDPITGRSDTWVPVYEDVGSNPDPRAKPGVYDVRSGATGTTEDGKPYQEL